MIGALAKPALKGLTVILKLHTLIEIVKTDIIGVMGMQKTQNSQKQKNDFAVSRNNSVKKDNPINRSIADPLRISNHVGAISATAIVPSRQNILFLHRTIGNQAVQRAFKSGALQARLKIGQPNDKYEQEADRLANTVMRMPDPTIQRKPT